MRDPRTWFVVLLIACVAGTYIFHVRPKTRRQWLFLALTIAFLAWLLLLMVTVRSAPSQTRRSTQSSANPDEKWPTCRRSEWYRLSG